MNAEETARIQDMHRARVIWRNGATGFGCTCGGAWPCRVLMLADDALRERARVAHAVRAYYTQP